MKMLRIWTIIGLFCAWMANAGTEMGGGGTRARWQAIFENPALFVEAPMVTFDTGDAGTLFSSVTLVCLAKRGGEEKLRHLSPYFPCDRWDLSADQRCLSRSRTPTYLERSRRQVEAGCEAGSFSGRACGSDSVETWIPLRFNLTVFDARGGSERSRPVMTLPYDIPDCEQD